MSLRFEPLTYERLEEAVRLIERVFPDYGEIVRKVYTVSLEKDKADEYWLTRTILDYWTVIDPGSNKIVALTGFYQLKDQSPEEIWLGWFCVDPAERGKGIGRKTLEWTIDEARKRGYKLFRLWTTTDPNEAVAQKLYESVGLKVYKEKYNKEDDETTLYRELKL